MDKHIKVTDELVDRAISASDAVHTPNEGLAGALFSDAVTAKKREMMRAALSVITPGDIVEATTIPVGDFLKNPGETTAAALRSE